MTEERWQLAYTIYEAAAPLAEPRRREYVHAAAPDPEIAAKVLALLEQIETASDWDDVPGADAVAPSTSLSVSLPEGASLGLIGPGGQ